MYIPVKNGKLNCIVEGSGEPVVFIHGFPLDLRIWQPQVEDLVSAGFQVVRYDMRGFGGSELPKDGRSYSHSEDLHRLLSSLELTSVNLVASSFGGEIAVDFALERGNLVKSLTLLSPNISGMEPNPDSPIGRWRELAKNGQIQSVKNEMLEHEITGNLHEQGKRLLERVISDYSMWHFINEDPRVVYHNIDRLGEIVSPTLIMVGGKESEWMKNAVRKADQEIQKSRYIELEGLNHFMNLEDPQKVNNRIIDFLSKIYY